MTEKTAPIVPTPPPPADTDESLEGRPPERRSRLLRVVQGITLGVVALLLGLLIWKVAFADKSGARLVDAIARGKRPIAPPVRLVVIWPHDETWPAPLHRALDDNVVALSELRGYPVVVNFWASWCIPCRDEATRLNAAAKANAGKVAFLGIDVQDLVPDAHHFLRRYHVSYVSIRDKSPSGSGSYAAYGLTGIPETYYIDPNGRIVGHSIGAVSVEELATQLGRLTGNQG